MSAFWDGESTAPSRCIWIKGIAIARSNAEGEVVVSSIEDIMRER